MKKERILDISESYLKTLEKLVTKQKLLFVKVEFGNFYEEERSI